jgi:hypothetical protein
MPRIRASRSRRFSQRMRKNARVACGPALATSPRRQTLVHPRGVCRNECNTLEQRRYPSGGDLRDCARRTDLAVRDGRAGLQLRSCPNERCQAPETKRSARQIAILGVKTVGRHKPGGDCDRSEARRSERLRHDAQDRRPETGEHRAAERLSPDKILVGQPEESVACDECTIVPGADGETGFSAPAFHRRDAAGTHLFRNVRSGAGTKRQPSRSFG